MRPYVICHMLVSLDGKVTGEFLSEGVDAFCEEYYAINRDFHADAFACGSTTMIESFTGEYYPDLSQYDSSCEDHIKIASKYAVSFDRRGRVGWREGVTKDQDPGYDGYQIIEILSEKADKRYPSYLKEVGASYLFIKEGIKEALEKLSNLYNIKTLLLEGGSEINGAFLREDCVDELSLVRVPKTAGTKDKDLFFEGLVVDFELFEVKRLESGCTWERYRRKK